MTDRSININVGQAQILDLDANEQEQFIAFTNNKTVITNDTSLTIENEIHFPIIRRLDSTTFLIADTRTDKLPNGHIYNFNGQLLKSFLLGDGLQDIIVQNKKIVATYFDEGVFGNEGPNNNGLAIFDLVGHQIFGFNSSIEKIGIDDCYCICKHKPSTVLFYAYSDFKVYELNVDSFEFTCFDTPDDFSGASAISSTNDKIIFHSSYHEKTSFFSWDKDKNEVVKFGNYSPLLKGIGNGKFLAFGDNGFTIITRWTNTATNMGFCNIGADGITMNICNSMWHLFGQTSFNLAFCCYLHQQFFNSTSVPGGRFSNSPTSQSPSRQTVKKL